VDTGVDGRLATSTPGDSALGEYEVVPPGRYWPGAAVNCTVSTAGNVIVLFSTPEDGELATGDMGSVAADVEAKP
jgi:hypothetical protein